MTQNKSKTELTKVQELVYELKVHDALAKNMITANPETLMSELRRILRANRISSIPVVDRDKLIGIISVEELVNWLESKEEDCPINEKMTANVKTLYSDEPLIHAVNKLEKVGFSCFPVIDRLGAELVGIVTKGDIIERLLRKLEIDYQEEEIHRYRASHIFEDIVGDNVSITFQSYVKGKDFHRAGEASSRIKKTLERLGTSPQIVRRAAIASYEAEMNLVIYTDGGTMTAAVQPDEIRIDVKDSGPGIADIQKAFQPGYSTASDWVRDLGFGAGMGLVNIKKFADRVNLTSKVGKGTHLKIRINTGTIKGNTEAG